MQFENASETPRNRAGVITAKRDVLIIDDVKLMVEAGTINFFFNILTLLLIEVSRLLAIDRTPAQPRMGSNGFDDRTSHYEWWHSYCY